VSWGNGPALTLAHGFTQNAGTWGRFGELLGIQHRVRAVDLPGHGGSTGIHGDLPTSAALLGAADIPSDYLGYSLGGRVALHLAVAHPERVARLVLIGSTGGIDDPALREARRATDEALADELDAGLALDAFLDRWLTQPLFRSLPEEASQRDARARNTTAGLAASLRECGTGTQTPLWDQLASIRRPVLVVAGALDVRFTVLGRRLVNALDPHHEGFARLALVPGAGHACHLERPELTARLVNAFLA
jgi:2-succinyl-6-hydroxy-2,4-cyclohexadiene-1-carboxylate synthase